MHHPEDTHYDGECWAWIGSVCRAFAIGAGGFLVLVILLACLFVRWYGA
jgi:hypothetical protein